MTKRVLTGAALAMWLLPFAAAAQEPARTVVRDRHVSLQAATVRYQGGERETQTDRTTRTLTIGASGELSLSNIAGDIVVTRGGGSEATIEIVKTARARTVEAAREMLQIVQVEVVERAGRAEVRTRYPDGRQRQHRNTNVSVAYTVAAPAGTRVTVRSISGNVQVSDITGDLALETVSGDVHVAKGGRISSAKSVSGNIEIVDTAVEGTLDAGSVSGNVAARRVKARSVSLSSVSGTALAEGVDCERAEMQSMSGNVEFTGPLTARGRYELQSHSGNVRVAISGSTGFEIEANSWSGSVRADGFPLKTTGGERGRGRRSLEGVVGDGSAVVSITTFSGNAVVSKR
jgi:DUF4097 and DUF4098 domain-containing protein YvlB